MRRWSVATPVQSDVLFPSRGRGAMTSAWRLGKMDIPEIPDFLQERRLCRDALHRRKRLPRRRSRTNRNARLPLPPPVACAAEGAARKKPAAPRTAKPAGAPKPMTVVPPCRSGDRPAPKPAPRRTARIAPAGALPPAVIPPEALASPRHDKLLSYALGGSLLVHLVVLMIHFSPFDLTQPGRQGTAARGGAGQRQDDGEAVEGGHSCAGEPGWRRQHRRRPAREDAAAGAAPQQSRAAGGRRHAEGGNARAADARTDDATCARRRSPPSSKSLSMRRNGRNSPRRTN